MRPTPLVSLATCVGATLPDGAGGCLIHRVVTDSRAALREGDLFVGLVGDAFDGGRFAADAARAGASAVIVARGTTVDVPVPTLRVDDPLAALQALAAHARDAFRGPVVAITGSNGKTTVKDMLVAALGGSRRVAASPMSYNSQVGVALSLLGLDPDADVALVECGISLPGEMARLAAMVRPTHGVWTNVGVAHLAGLGTRAGIASEKAKLFAGVAGDAWVAVPEDEALARDALDALGAPTRAVARDDGLPDDPRLAGPLRAVASLAVAVAEWLGAPRARALAGVAAWTPAPMRLEFGETHRGVRVINDAYTSDPESLEAALSVLVRRRKPGQRALAVLGGMAQLGSTAADAHRRAGERVAELGVDVVIGIGEGGREIGDAARAAASSTRVFTVDEVAEAAEIIERETRSGDVVLLKASRPQKLERLAPLLFGALAPGRAIVDLDTLVLNYRRLEALAGDGTAVMPVIKSNGYGLGAERLALELEAAGARNLCVAYADEGVALRDAGVRAAILVQNIVPEDVPKVVAYRLTAEVASAALVDQLAAAGAASGDVVADHLKVDTGMTRSGVAPADAVPLARRIVDNEWLDLDGVMTHFAGADEPELDAFTRTQIARFDGAVSALSDAGICPRVVHACNSVGTLRFPEARYSMVRSGIGLLGYARVDGASVLPTEPVLTLTTRVVAVRDVPVGDGVGYGLTWVAERPSRIAMVAIGYGDGYPRGLSNRGWMSVAGHRCPVVGRVCMDVTMLDVTDVPGAIAPGDEVVAFGPGPGDPSLAEHAEWVGTIPYELLTGLSSRVRRLYRRSH